MKKSVLFAAAIAACASLLVVGCSSTVGNDSQSSSKAESPAEETTESNQEEAEEVEAPSYSEDELYLGLNIPLQVGEYTLLKQPEAKDAGICSDQIPIFEEGGGWAIRYANEEAIQHLTEINSGGVFQCWGYGTRSFAPYEGNVHPGLIEIQVDADAGSSEDTFVCESWDDGQASACRRGVASSGAYLVASGNFGGDAALGEQTLTEILDIVAPMFKVVPQSNGA
ncbi:hypothetical protein ICM05_09795 [Leucobacter sp. cx-42]|uniref:hypothetical protein n=1 Tax=unclassified Leucobacter TaxID=2621730 RepID=UPI00165E42B0|nr:MULTISPECIES: hypothetical protein [unclassified Leucobacter]MBC9954929.1 hypothetical protein [Leucobacter sp. cx-42]